MVLLELIGGLVVVGLISLGLKTYLSPKKRTRR